MWLAILVSILASDPIGHTRQGGEVSFVGRVHKNSAANAKGFFALERCENDPADQPLSPLHRGRVVALKDGDARFRGNQFRDDLLSDVRLESEPFWRRMIQAVSRFGGPVLRRAGAVFPRVIIEDTLQKLV